MFLCTFQLVIFPSSYRKMFMTPHPDTSMSVTSLWRRVYKRVDPLQVGDLPNFIRIWDKNLIGSETWCNHLGGIWWWSFSWTHIWRHVCYWQAALRWLLCEGMTYQLIAQVPVLSSTSKGELSKSILCGISLMVTLTYWFIFPELVCLVTLKSCRLQLTKRVAVIF